MIQDHEAFLGVYVDHLYENCSNLTRVVGRTRCGHPHDDEDVARVGDRALGLVDPRGTDICGLCRRRWERKQP